VRIERSSKRHRGGGDPRSSGGDEGPLGKKREGGGRGVKEWREGEREREREREREDGGGGGMGRTVSLLAPVIQHREAYRPVLGTRCEEVVLASLPPKEEGGGR
jgi:hypothetical protein